MKIDVCLLKEGLIDYVNDIRVEQDLEDPTKYTFYFTPKYPVERTEVELPCDETSQ